jgi:poly-gamma-glutamate synthesis protein (capsule biosynthesis protein)
VKSAITALILIVSAQGKATDSSEVILRFGGDVLLGAHYEADVGTDIHRCFADFESFRNDDLSMVNLENPVTTRGTPQRKPFTFRMHPRFIAALKMGGIDIVNLANNHIYDFGRAGLFDTIASLDSAGVPHVGAGRDHDEAHQPFITTIKGLRIGVLGYYGGRESPAARGKVSGVASRDLRLIVRDIRSLKGKADYIVVNFHWGTEKAKRPDRAQRRFAHAVIDAGADAIIGHHPHVLQGVEVYRNKVIAYSLGNLVFGGNSRHTYDTGIFEIRLATRRAISAEKRAAYSFKPVRVRQWNASALAGKDSAVVVNEVRKLSSIFPKSIFH